METLPSAGIQRALRDYIAAEFLPGEDPESLTDDTPLVTGGILDSIATVKLIGWIEERFGAQIEPHEMDVEHLDFLPDIAALVVARQRQA